MIIDNFQQHTCAICNDLFIEIETHPLENVPRAWIPNVYGGPGLVTAWLCETCIDRKFQELLDHMALGTAQELPMYTASNTSTVLVNTTGGAYEITGDPNDDHCEQCGDRRTLTVCSSCFDGAYEAGGDEHECNHDYCPSEDYSYCAECGVDNDETTILCEACWNREQEVETLRRNEEAVAAQPYTVTVLDDGRVQIEENE